MEAGEYGSSCKRHVLVFGKTGAGKSTTASMLVDGELLATPTFQMGNGVLPVTATCQHGEGRGNYVIDTVGLGEGGPGGRSNKTMTDIIYDFLKLIQRNKYSHLLYVTEVGRIDSLDDAIWALFRQVFKGAEKAMVVVFSMKNNEDPEDWIEARRSALGKMYELPGTGLKSRFVGCAFPPVHKNKILEGVFAEMRVQSLLNLETFLDTVFQENSPNGDFFQADFQKLPDGKLKQFAAWLYDFILDIAKELMIPVKEFLVAIGTQFVRSRTQEYQRM